MTAYATVADVQAGLTRQLSTTEQTACQELLEEAAIIIDAYNADAEDDSKKVVSCRMVRRAIGDGGGSIPMGATQASQSGLGYSESFTFGSGSAGEVYLSKLEKKLLGLSDRIGARSPLESMTWEAPE
jgi:hypothetical protein